MSQTSATIPAKHQTKACLLVTQKYLENQLVGNIVKSPSKGASGFGPVDLIKEMWRLAPQCLQSSGERI